jgi:hypothetical protein
MTVLDGVEPRGFTGGPERATLTANKTGGGSSKTAEREEIMKKLALAFSLLCASLPVHAHSCHGFWYPSLSLSFGFGWGWGWGHGCGYGYSAGYWPGYSYYYQPAPVYYAAPAPAPVVYPAAVTATPAPQPPPAPAPPPVVNTTWNNHPTTAMSSANSLFGR